MNGANLETSWIHVTTIRIGFKCFLGWVDDVGHFGDLVESFSVDAEMDDLKWRVSCVIIEGWDRGGSL